jgi:hypothetical protein
LPYPRPDLSDDFPFQEQHLLYPVFATIQAWEGILATFKTQHEAIEWAKKNGHAPHVARVRHLSDKKKADHWRIA